MDTFPNIKPSYGQTKSSRPKTRTIRFADFGPRPGNLEINFTRSSISLIFCINYNGHLKPGMPKPPVAFEISSVVLDFT